MTIPVKFVRFRATLVDGTLIVLMGVLTTIGYKINDKLSLITTNQIKQEVYNNYTNQAIATTSTKDHDQDEKIDELYKLVFNRPKETDMKDYNDKKNLNN
jgi:hypothetical protein